MIYSFSFLNVHEFLCVHITSNDYSCQAFLCIIVFVYVLFNHLLCFSNIPIGKKVIFWSKLAICQLFAKKSTQVIISLMCFLVINTITNFALLQLIGEQINLFSVIPS